MKLRAKPNIVTALIGLVFFSFGLGIFGIFSGPTISSYNNSANWVEVPATVRFLKLNTGRGRKPTYIVEGNYSYDFDGVKYRSDRISNYQIRDNSDFWPDLLEWLRAEQKSRELMALVDPKDPTQAVLYRTLHWNVIVFSGLFLMIFCPIGLFIIYISLFGRGRQAKKSEQESGSE